MKRILYILSLGILTALPSCSDILDVAPEGSTSLDEVFSEEITAGAYLNTCYGSIQNYGGYADYFNTNSRIGMSDDAWEYHQAAAHVVMNIYDGKVSPTNNKLNNNGNGFNAWNTYFEGIRNCNLFLEYIVKTPMDENVKERWIAEAKVLRAFYNLELISRFGGLPIIKDLRGLDYDVSQYKRESFKTCVDEIIKDCQSGIDSPNLPWRITIANEGGRMTKAIAEAIKSRAILYAASPLWNDGNDYWNEAEQITRDALEKCLANGYELYTRWDDKKTFTSSYQEYFCKQMPDYSEDPIDKETILASQQAQINWLNIHGMTKIQGANKAGLCPTQELVDAYCMKTTGLPVLKLDKPYNDIYHLEPNYYPNSGYDVDNPYLNRDPRFYATIYYNGSKRINEKSVLTEIGTYIDSEASQNDGNCRTSLAFIQADVKYTHTGYYVKKYDHPNATKKSKIGTKYPFYRMAELYLNYAEAANENGHTEEAIKQINIIRDRVGMPHVDLNMNKDEARLWIRNERRVELAYEENRHYDLRRWNNPDGDLKDEMEYLTGMVPIRTVAADKSYTEELVRFTIGDSYNRETKKWLGNRYNRQCVDNKWLLWPLDAAEVNRLETATGDKWQNPGW